MAKFLKIIGLALVIHFLLRPTPQLAQAKKLSHPISTVEVLQHFSDATYGAKHSLSTLRVRGTMNVPPTQDEANFEFLFKAPDSDVFTFETFAHGEVKIGHDHGKVWSRTRMSSSGTTPLTFAGATPRMMSRMWKIFEVNDWKSTYSKIELIGISSVNGKDAYVVRFTPREGDPHLRYFDSSSFLLVRVDYLQRVRWSDQDKDRGYLVSVNYFDYRPHDGIQLPQQVEIGSSGAVARFTTTGVSVDAPIGQSLFTNPAQN
jgi:hypothetical protein